MDEQTPIATEPVAEPTLPAPTNAVEETKVAEEVIQPEQSVETKPEEAKFIPPPENLNLPTLTMSEIPVEMIKPNPWQPRKTFNEEALDDLTNSIKEHGILQPLVVVPLPDGTYQLIVGERRLRAAKAAGMSKVPVIVRDYLEEQKKLELALIENIQRHNLDPIEEGLAYKRLSEEYHLTQDEVAKRVGKGRTTVTNMIRLLHLPLKIQNGIAEAKITEGHGRAILGLNGMEKQIALFEMILSQNMTVRQVEEKVRELMDRPKVVRAPRGPSDPEVSALETELRGKLGTKVKVQKNGESGKITIEFFSKEELNTFMDKMKRLEQ